MTMSKIERLKGLGLTAEQILAVVEIIDEEVTLLVTLLEKRRKQNAERQQRFKAKKGNVTGAVTQKIQPKQVVKQGKVLSVSSPKVVDLFPESLPKKVTNTRARAKIGTRLAVDWIPDPKDTARVAQECNLSPAMAAREFEKFRDYWCAKSGATATKLDWQATWRNWLRKASEMGPVSKYQPRMTEREKADAIFNEAIRQAEAREQSGQDDLEQISDGYECLSGLRPRIGRDPR